jgi:hypothetical protein
MSGVLNTGETPCGLSGAATEAGLTGLLDLRFGIPGDYGVSVCRACGSEQVSPIPSAAELKQLYSDHYNFGGETNTPYTRLDRRIFRSVADRAWLRVDLGVSFRIRGRGRLLDVGCNEWLVRRVTRQRLQRSGPEVERARQRPFIPPNERNPTGEHPAPQ